MRTRKPAATSKGPACHRCTALLHAGVERCSMCGWPAGVGYPPVDGELEQAVVPTPEPEGETAHADEQAGAQLDALAGMAERRSEPMPVADDATATLEAVPPAGEEPATEAPSDAEATADVDDSSTEAD